MSCTKIGFWQQNDAGRGENERHQKRLMTEVNRESPGPTAFGRWVPGIGPRGQPRRRAGDGRYRHRATVACTLTCLRLHLGCKVLGVRAGAALEDVGEADLGSGRRGTEV